jgi:hypothetical protein
MNKVRILLSFLVALTTISTSSSLGNFYIYGNIECLFSGGKIFDGTFTSLAFHKKKSKWTNMLTIKIASEGDDGVVLAIQNPDPNNINDFKFVGKPDLIYIEVKKDETRVRFNTFPNEKGPSFYEFAIDPFDLMNFNTTVHIYQCN